MWAASERQRTSGVTRRVRAVVKSRTGCGEAGHGSAELHQPPLDQAPLRVIVNQRQGTVVGLARLFRSTETAEQLAPRRVKVAVVLESEAVDDLEPRLGTMRFGHRNRPAQLDDRRGGEPGQLAVQAGDLRPVARLVGMQ